MPTKEAKVKPKKEKKPKKPKVSKTTTNSNNNKNINNINIKITERKSRARPRPKATPQQQQFKPNQQAQGAPATYRGLFNMPQPIYKDPNDKSLLLDTLKTNTDRLYSLLNNQSNLNRLGTPLLSQYAPNAKTLLDKIATAQPLPPDEFEPEEINEGNYENLKVIDDNSLAKPPSAKAQLVKDPTPRPTLRGSEKFIPDEEEKQAEGENRKENEYFDIFVNRRNKKQPSTQSKTGFKTPKKVPPEPDNNPEAKISNSQQKVIKYMRYSDGIIINEKGVKVVKPRVKNAKYEDFDYPYDTPDLGGPNFD